jgi:hypothetical protein
MFRAALGLVLAFLTTSATAGAAGAAQPLAVAVGDAGQQVRSQPRYTPAAPIDVRVEAPRARAAALIGVAPDGANVRVPLTRASAGVFTGSATLPEPGTWSLAVATTADDVEVTGTTFTVTVEPGPSGLEIGGLIALALASIGGGVGLIATRRNTAAPREETRA